LHARELGVAEPALANTDTNEETLELSHAETLFRREVSYDGQTFVLGREMEVEVLRGDGVWVFRANECGLMGFGDTRGDAESMFGCDLSVKWDWVACEDDDGLTQGAREMKRALLAMVRSAG
jgi:hypothetical protein